MNVPRLIIAASAAVSLSLGLGGLSGGVLAQTNSGVVVIDDASGTNGTNGTCTNAGPRRTRTRAAIYAQTLASPAPTRPQRRHRSLRR